MDSLGLPTPRAIDDYSPRQPTIFYLSLTRRTIYDTAIAIENKLEHKDEDKHNHYLRREFSYSNYEQSYTLPDDVERDKISAKVENGILTITMPKTEPKQKVTKAIEVA